jgi:hypothetical protein
VIGFLRFVVRAVLALYLMQAGFVHAEDVVRRYRVNDGLTDRQDYNLMLITEAMRRTEKKYGPWRLENHVDNLVRERVLAELLTGERVNLGVYATQSSWEEKLTPIRIPVDMGLAGYRVSLIRRQNQSLIAAVSTEAALKQLSVTAGASWSSRKVFEVAGFRVQPGTSQQAMLGMLMTDRVDLFPRGLGEAVQELAHFRSEYPDLAIEQSQVIYFPLPTYFFVSPKAPRIALRLEEGLESMVRDGSLLRMVKRVNTELIEEAAFCKRRIFRIENPLLTPQTPLTRKELWFDPYDRKSGLCSAGKASARATVR